LNFHTFAEILVMKWRW